MHVITARNVNTALPKAINYLLESGVAEPSRNGPVLVSPTPVTTVYERPWERVLFSPLRNANPFFHFFESLWMLAGRNDLEFPKLFNSKFGAYSDDGKTIRGAYGHRWQRWFGYDQLAVIAKELRENPSSRRCVLAMWDGGETSYPTNTDIHGGLGCEPGDLLASTVDKPCLGGETVLQSPEGSATLQELAQMFNSGELIRWPVLSFDTESKKQVLTWCSNVWRSGKKKIYEVAFDDGSVVRATADHRFFRKMWNNRVFCEEVKVCELVPGMRVWASSLLQSNRGYLYYKNQLDQNTSFSNWRALHRDYYELVYGPLDDGLVVHHRDEQKLINRITNLEAMPKPLHDSLHRMGANNPMRKLSPSRRAEKGVAHSEAMLDYWRNKKEKVNHVVVSVTFCGVEDVYDFEVPENHNAMLSNGVYTHNCNTHIYFRVRQDKHHGSTTQISDPPVLDMTVCCRSNDILWGAYGANAVHMSFLQEYMAAAIGVAMGKYYQISNNFHLYTEVLSKEKAMAMVPDCYLSNYYEQFSNLASTPLVSYGLDDWQRELGLFMKHPGHCDILEPFFRYVATPMWEAWLERNNKNGAGLRYAKMIEAADWRTACVRWLERREAAKEAKNV